MIIDANS